MEPNRARLKLHQPASYRIRVQGALDESWAADFTGLTLACAPNALPAGMTILTGRMADQAALLGLLNRLYGLGLPLLSVEWLADD
jgi:hypothetical protein